MVRARQLKATKVGKTGMLTQSSRCEYAGRPGTAPTQAAPSRQGGITAGIDGLLLNK